ncbi:DUF397 domain-containing protein [Actinocatenispora sera]|jgi:hypothetical protein|nr:DUF397 domain-containing protein [Actinocatenispora sera]
MGLGHTPRQTWRKSSHSGGTNCVETLDLGNHIAVRDSKNPEDVLVVDARAWREFLKYQVQAG